MNTNESAAFMMLAELPRVGERALERIERIARERHLQLHQILELPPSELHAEYRLPERAIARLTRERRQHEEHCREIRRRLETAGVHLCRPRDPDYPARWRDRLCWPPPALYWYGHSGALHAPTVAVLSSRLITERTVTATVQIVQHAGRAGFALVSGGMKSTHRIAAVAIRAAAAARAVVLDRGFFAAFGSSPEVDPFGFGPGRSPLDVNRTLVLSPFRPFDHAAPRNGRRRDELVAALADIIVAVSARPGGVIERICLQALDGRRCVLSWQGENAGLVAAGATPIDDADLRAGLARFLQRS